MQENNSIKIARVINLPALNIKQQLNINIDSNTHVKQVLNIETCLIDHKIEPMSGKALIKGTLGIKAIYIDTDNMCNSVSDSVNFSETLINENISPDCFINIYSSHFISDFNSDNNTLHINVDGNIECMSNINENINLYNQINENMVCKKSSIQSYNHIQSLNKTVNFDFDFKLGAKINKMLSCDSKVIVDECKCYDGYILVSGQIINTIIYEIDNGGHNLIKISTSSAPFKSEIEASACDGDCVADLTCRINMNSTQIATNISENDTQFDFEYNIDVAGNIYKTINIDVIEDLYSLDNEVEIIKNTYALCKKTPSFKTTENVDAEITLADELNIDEILGMVNTNANVTQYSVKDNLIIVEGVINGNLLYLDENREIRYLSTQLPYSINIKQELNNKVCSMHLTTIPTSCKCKIKRGNTLMLDYELFVTGSAYTQVDMELIDNVKLGKIINYGDIAFQIYLAHSNESCWDLCKRLHITQEHLIECNKENPATYLGGEKIIVYR